MSAPEVIVMGASLGGSDALPIVLAQLPKELPIPVVIAQHRAPQLEPRLAELLASRTGLEFVDAEDQASVSPGRVYLAPPNYHLLIDDGVFELSVDAPVNYSRPSIDVLFESVARSSMKEAVGVLLTGSSEDGAAGLAAFAKRGWITVVQDPDEAEFPIAPRAALARMRPSHVLSLGGIATLLARMS